MEEETNIEVDNSKMEEILKIQIRLNMKMT